MEGKYVPEEEMREIAEQSLMQREERKAGVLESLKKTRGQRDIRQILTGRRVGRRQRGEEGQGPES